MGYSNIIFIHGREAFLVDEEIRKLVKDFSLNDEGAEIEYLDAEALNPRALLEKLDFSPLFALKRMVIIKNPYWLGKVRKKAELEEIVQLLEEYVKRDYAGQMLVIAGLESEASNPVAQWLKKNTKVIKCEVLSKPVLRKWIESEFARRNKKVKHEAVNLLAESGQDMYYIFNLIEKLSLMENEVVTEEDVAGEIENKEEIKVFKFTDALLKRDLKEAFDAYYKLREQGVSVIFILYMVVRQFMVLGKVKFYLEKGYNKKQIEEKTGIKNFVINRMAVYAKNYSSEELKFFFSRFLEIDLALKGGMGTQNEDIIMETVISEICG
ncbi:DNA polymerase III subunit delta [Thermosyntropha sp.]|uniref:DNA polymerase III subunit delta n=1 Tax=Thermosyntropha sp. TaxID=2740820 RepID=UPI0025E28A52|nr:DNA polymerase III subunit delta [Thermosyntropha sp.]MBO8159163.1 DNA polymerase III subunit delta [Thermosyntropha sp.]